MFYVVFGAPELRNHVIYVLLWLEPSKNYGLAAFMRSKIQPIHGFGGSEAPKPRVLRGFGGSRTMIFRPGSRKISYFTWFWSILGSKIVPRGPPGGLPSGSGGPRGRQEGPRRPLGPETTLKPRILRGFGGPRNRNAGLREGNRDGFWAGEPRALKPRIPESQHPS